MKTLVEKMHQSPFGGLPFVGRRVSDKCRFVVGVGINVAGIVVFLLANVLP